MNIKELYPKINYYTDIKGVTCNSKKVKSNYIFVAIKGKNYNGQRYIKEALQNGACLIITDQMVLGNYNHIRVENAKKEYVRLLKKFYHYKPDIYTVGITGTDGKTTTASMLSTIFNSINRAAYIGTNGIRYLNKVIRTPNTTPSPSLLYPAIRVFHKHHIKDMVMEVSSEGILDGRIEGLTFNGAIFTNLSHEHLNTHQTMEQYFRCKAVLFQNVHPQGLVVVNSDDPYAGYIRFYTQAKLISYGIRSGQYQAKNIKLNFKSTAFDLYYQGIFIEHFILPFFGQYNVYNALAAIAYAFELGIDIKTIKISLESMQQIEGRFMNFTNKNEITGIVDFAHTPHALASLLSNLLEFKKNRLILIVGAAGEKDASKRCEMGKIATNYADITIFTSEDPKNENLFNIMLDLIKDVTDKDYYLTLTRAEAIHLAKQLAQPKDFIVITGKGNEQSEQIYNYVFKHNDYELLKKELT